MSRRMPFVWSAVTTLALSLLPCGARGQGDLCARLRSSQVECDPGVPGRYVVTFRLENTSTIPVDRLFLAPLSPGLVVSPDEFILLPVAPGDVSGDLHIVIEVDPTVPPGGACVDLSVHDSATGECCVRNTVCPQLGPCGGGQQVKRADANLDNKTDISDPIYILGFLFLGLAPTSCLETMDVDDNGAIEITDAISFLNYLFLGGRAPPAPFPDCGVDSSEDSLPCDGYRFCQ